MSVFSFPNPVNDVAARTVAAGVIIMAAVALGFDLAWMTIPLAYGFVARVLSGPTLSPLGQFATRIVAPRLGRRARLVPGPPKRFAQAMGAAFTLAALICWLGGARTATFVLLAVLLVPATLEAGFGYCVGCKVFGLLMRAGLIPESICLECADLWGPRAVAARSAASRSTS
jgi:hypothetical protein